jgi:hypothetical protein
MQPRRSLRLVVGALVLAAPLLTSCGFDKATDRVYTPAAGINDRDGDVDVLSAVIVSAQTGSGTFIASLSNNLTKADDTETLTGVASADDSSGLTFTPASLSIDIAPRGFVNLVDEEPIVVRGDFTPGQVEKVTLTFASGDTTTMDVPVVYACNAYEDLDVSADQPESTDSSSPSSSPSDEASASPTASASPAGEPYNCDAVGVD